jgi:23S rRNA (guanosine2251-2'-O)-methyltransferase
MERKQMDQLAGHTRHQGVIARIKVPEALREDALPSLIEEAGPGGMFLLLDGVTDPHNLGACLRSAAAAEVTAVIVPKDRAVGLNETVIRSSAGTALQVPLLMATNLVRVMEVLKRANVWLYGADLDDGARTIYQTDLRGPIGIVMGAEGSGLRRLTREHCDALVYVPIADSVESLNVSVTAGIMLFEARRQRSAA